MLCELCFAAGCGVAVAGGGGGGDHDVRFGGGRQVEGESACREGVEDAAGSGEQQVRGVEVFAGGDAGGEPGDVLFAAAGEFAEHDDDGAQRVELVEVGLQAAPRGGCLVAHAEDVVGGGVGSEHRAGLLDAGGGFLPRLAGGGVELVGGVADRGVEPGGERGLDRGLRAVAVVGSGVVEGEAAEDLLDVARGEVLYRDARVFAYRVPSGTRRQADLRPRLFASGVLDTATSPVRTNGDAGVPLDTDRLSSGSLATPTYLAGPSNAAPTWVRFEFPRPVTVTGLTVAAGNGFSGWNDILDIGPVAQVWASTDNRHWKPVAEDVYTGGLVSNDLQRTVFVRSTRARFFKVVFLPGGTLGDRPSYLPPLTGKEPITLRSLVLRTAPTVHRFEAKAGFGKVANYYEIDTPAAGSAPAVPRSQVLDLTPSMDRSGRLRWKAPAGTWVVVRLGYGLTGKQNGPATPAATGLEVDKLDARRVRAYLNTYLDSMRDAAGAGAFGATGLTGLLNDSYEAGFQNWTDDILAEFRRRRGYDPSRYLPALTGTAVGSGADSDRFLWDWRRTLAELMADNHYGVLTEVAHERGLQRTYAEAQENNGGWFGDDMEMRRYADIPMGASGLPSAPGDQILDTYRVDMRGASSVANVYGRRHAGAESFTFTPLGTLPGALKPTADQVLVAGVNRFMIHTSAHQPLDTGPGISLGGIGWFFTRNETWAEQARPFTSYLARCCHVLSQGRAVKDVAYFYGQESAITGIWGSAKAQPDVPLGYDFDFVNSDVVLNHLRVDNGKLVTPSGMSYSLLYLGGRSERLTLPVLRRLAELVEQGAALAGVRPTASPSLADDDREWQRTADRLWGEQQEHDRVVGAGRVFTGFYPEEALSVLGVSRDFDHAQTQDPTFDWIHRRTDDADVYFVVNRRAVRSTLAVTMRATGRAVELWDPVSGEVRAASFTTTPLNRTAMTLDLGPSDSVFVVIARGAPGSATVPVPPRKVLTVVEGAWDVGFQAGRGAPASTTLPFLRNLADDDDPGVRYFSGTATYTRSVDVPAFGPSDRLVLDLGEVLGVATVTVNGDDIGTLWRAPFALDVSGALRPGANTIRVAVTNSWLNRLVGDAQPGATRIAQFPGRGAPAATTPLQPSGMLGPVRVHVVG